MLPYGVISVAVDDDLPGSSTPTNTSSYMGDDAPSIGFLLPGTLLAVFSTVQ